MWFLFHDNVNVNKHITIVCIKFKIVTLLEPGQTYRSSSQGSNFQAVSGSQKSTLYPLSRACCQKMRLFFTGATAVVWHTLYKHWCKTLTILTYGFISQAWMFVLSIMIGDRPSRMASSAVRNCRICMGDIIRKLRSLFQLSSIISPPVFRVRRKNPKINKK